jgi:hypothetical protein
LNSKRDVAVARRSRPAAIRTGVASASRGRVERDLCKICYAKKQRSNPEVEFFHVRLGFDEGANYDFKLFATVHDEVFRF